MQQGHSFHANSRQRESPIVKNRWPAAKMPYSSRRIAALLLTVLLAGSAAGAGVAPPPEPIFDAAKFGAKGDGQTDDRAALQQAIDACKGSGGSVYLHDGVFRSGQLVLGSRMTFYVAPSATLQGIQSTAEADYPSKDAPFENHMNATCRRRLLYGEALTDVILTGGGTIDGQGDFPPWRNAPGRKVPERERPSLLEFARSARIEVSDLRLVRSAMWTQVYLECVQVRLLRQTVDTGNVPGTRDGMDVCDCHDVRIEDCNIRAQDDGICFKSGSSVGCRDITVRRCSVDKLGNSAGNCLKFGTSSVGGFAHVLCEELRLANSGNSAISWESVDGAVIEQVVVRNCVVSHVGQVIGLILGRRGSHPERVGGSISDVRFEQITADSWHGQVGCLISGSPGLPIRNLRFVGLRLKFPGGMNAPPGATPEYAGDYPEGTHFGPLPGYAFYVRHVDGISFEDCEFSTERPDARSWLAAEDTTGLVARDVRAGGARP